MSDLSPSSLYNRVVVGSYGGGTNSQSLYIGMVRMGYPPPYAILMADTGGEWPHTYKVAAEFSAWLEAHGYPPILIVKKGGRQETLEEQCLRLGVLPAIAYGYKTCSQKFKVEPQDKWCNNDAACRQEWKSGRKVVKLIGYDYDELHRARFYDDKKYELLYPLIEWKWGRERCVEEIAAAGLPQPGKSSCFFCPHMRKSEILLLKERHPDLLERALAIEDRARPRLTGVKIKGLGRKMAWRDFLTSQDDRTPEDAEPICGCYDGGDFENVTG